MRLRAKISSSWQEDLLAGIAFDLRGSAGDYWPHVVEQREKFTASSVDINDR
jgi:hypothetical protein